MIIDRDVIIYNKYPMTCTVEFLFFFSSRRRHTRLQGDWSSDVCSSDLIMSKVRSVHDPRVRNGLCRYIRSKGMIVNIGEKPENDSLKRQFLAVDKNTMD